MISFIFILYIFHTSNADNWLVDEYVNDINLLQNESQSWVYPKNSYSYLRPNFNPNSMTISYNLQVVGILVISVYFSTYL